MKQGEMKIHEETTPKADVMFRTCMERGREENRV